MGRIKTVGLTQMVTLTIGALERWSGSPGLPWVLPNWKLLLKILGRGPPRVMLHVGHLAWQVEEVTLQPWRTSGDRGLAYLSVHT